MDEIFALFRKLRLSFSVQTNREWLIGVLDFYLSNKEMLRSDERRSRSCSSCSIKAKLHCASVLQARRRQQWGLTGLLTPVRLTHQYSINTHKCHKFGHNLASSHLIHTGAFSEHHNVGIVRAVLLWLRLTHRGKEIAIKEQNWSKWKRKQDKKKKSLGRRNKWRWWQPAGVSDHTHLFSHTVTHNVQMKADALSGLVIHPLIPSAIFSCYCMKDN